MSWDDARLNLRWRIKTWRRNRWWAKYWDERRALNHVEFFSRMRRERTLAAMRTPWGQDYYAKKWGL